MIGRAGKLEDIGDKEARTKTSQALRDMVARDEMEPAAKCRRAMSVATPAQAPLSAEGTNRKIELERAATFAKMERYAQGTSIQTDQPSKPPPPVPGVQMDQPLTTPPPGIQMSQPTAQPPSTTPPPGIQTDQPAMP